MSSEEAEVFLTTDQLADRWQISPLTLQSWRVRRLPPIYVKIGGLVRYKMSDILEHEEARHRPFAVVPKGEEQHPDNPYDEPEACGTLEGTPTKETSHGQEEDASEKEGT